MAPLIPEVIPESLNFIVALLIGIGFGFTLEQAGFSSTRKLVGLFYGYDFTVLRVFFTAGVTAMIGILVLSHLGMVDATLLYINPTFLSSALVGGVVMGAGFILGGFCPGTSACAAAVGRIDALIFLGGSVLGIFLFGELYPLLEPLYLAQSMGPVLMPDVLGMSPVAFGLALTGMAMVAFVVVGRIEDRVSDEPQSWVSRRNAVVLMGIPFVVLLALLVFPTRKERWLKKAEQLVVSEQLAPRGMDADKLASEILDHYGSFNLIDVRSEAEYAQFHLPTAVNVPFEQLTEAAAQKYLQQTYRANVFYGSSAGQAHLAAALAVVRGKARAEWASVGANEFKWLFFESSSQSEPVTRHDFTVFRFRQDASEKLKEIARVTSVKKAPEMKKSTKIKGGCS